MGLSARTVANKRCKLPPELHHFKRIKNHIWTKKEDDYIIKNHPKHESKELAASLGLNALLVATRVKTLGLKNDQPKPGRKVKNNTFLQTIIK
jgi:hypothetical protein